MDSVNAKSVCNKRFFSNYKIIFYCDNKIFKSKEYIVPKIIDYYKTMHI
jgi:hypothetical protein